MEQVAQHEICSTKDYHIKYSKNLSLNLLFLEKQYEDEDKYILFIDKSEFTNKFDSILPKENLFEHYNEDINNFLSKTKIEPKSVKKDSKNEMTNENGPKSLQKEGKTSENEPANLQTDSYFSTNYSQLKTLIKELEDKIKCALENKEKPIVVFADFENISKHLIQCNPKLNILQKLHNRPNDFKYIDKTTDTAAITEQEEINKSHRESLVKHVDVIYDRLKNNLTNDEKVETNLKDLMEHLTDYNSSLDKYDNRYKIKETICLLADHILKSDNSQIYGDSLLENIKKISNIIKLEFDEFISQADLNLKDNYNQLVSHVRSHDNKSVKDLSIFLILIQLLVLSVLVGRENSKPKCSWYRFDKYKENINKLKTISINCSNALQSISKAENMTTAPTPIKNGYNSELPYF